MDEKNVVNKFDGWLKDDSTVAALVMRQWLMPTEGKDAVVFPPTYAKPEGIDDSEWTGYNIDRLDDGTSVCLMDSVGSQANRMEPIFMREPYSKLVPQIYVEVQTSDGKKSVSLLEAGHRAADAIVRFSELSKTLSDAFLAIKNRGDARPLAQLAPTSLVFGVWDSRDTQVKQPRIVRSVIRAYDVQFLHRSAQYIPPVDYQNERILNISENMGKSASEMGLRHAPAAWTHGGVLVKREIRRDASLNLAALRALGAGDSDDPMPLRRYVLGLSLVALTAPQETFLREGCQLVPDPERPAEWHLVHHDGSRKEWRIEHDNALEFAEAAASDFGVDPAPKTFAFDSKRAETELKKTKQERKARKAAEEEQEEETR